MNSSTKKLGCNQKKTFYLALENEQVIGCYKTEKEAKDRIHRLDEKGYDRYRVEKKELLVS